MGVRVGESRPEASAGTGQPRIRPIAQPESNSIYDAGWLRETIGRCSGRSSGERVVVSVGENRRGEGLIRHSVSARNRSAASATAQRAAAETEGGVSARGALVRRMATARASHIARDHRLWRTMRFSQATPRPASEQPQCGQRRTDDGRSDHSPVTTARVHRPAPGSAGSRTLDGAFDEYRSPV